MIYGYKSSYPECSCQITHEETEQPNPWLAIGACIVGLAIGAGLVFGLAWIATHLRIGPFLTAFILASMLRWTFK